MMRTTCLTAAALVAVTSPTALPGQEVTLPALLREAEAENPSIVAARGVADAATARVSQAGALPDPTLGLGFMNVPIARPGLGADMMTMTQLQVGARLPWPGKLGMREEVASLRAEAEAWEVERVRDEVAAGVKSAYYRVYFVDRALEVTGRNEMLLGDFAQLTSSKYAVGTGAQTDVLKAQVERSRLDDQRLALREQRASVVARLNALLGRPADAPLPSVELPDEVRIAALTPSAGGVGFASASLADVVPGADAPGGPVPPAAALQELALEHSPMIQAHVRRVAAQERSVALARVATFPDLSVSAGYSYRAGFGDFFNLMVSAPLPIFSGRKQDQAVVEQDASLAEHEALHHAMVHDVNAEISSLSAALRRARDQLVLLQEGMLPQARTSLASATASYRVGRVDFLTLLDAQVTLYRHELDYHRLLADFAANLAELERVVGTEVLR